MANNTAGIIAAQAIMRYYVLAVEQMVHQVEVNAANDLAQAVAVYAVALEDEFKRNVRAGVETDMRGVAEVMRSAALKQLTANRKGPVGLSRAGDPGINRRFPGAIEGALAKTFLPASDGIVVSFDALEQAAIHWQRINAGAGEAAGSNPFVVPQIMAARPAFSIPGGWWSNGPGGGGQKFGFGEATGQFFFPMMHNGVKYPTRGIQGKFFIEAALEQARVAFPEILQNRVNAWKKAVESGRGSKIAGLFR